MLRMMRMLRVMRLRVMRLRMMRLLRQKSHSAIGGLRFPRGALRRALLLPLAALLLDRGASVVDGRVARAFRGGNLQSGGRIVDRRRLPRPSRRAPPRTGCSRVSRIIRITRSRITRSSIRIIPIIRIRSHRWTTARCSSCNTARWRRCTLGT